VIFYEDRFEKKLKYIIKFIYRILKKCLSTPEDFYTYYKSQKQTSVQKKFSNKLSFFRHETKRADGVLLVQMVKNYEFTLKFAALSKIIAQKSNLQVSFYEVDIHCFWKSLVWTWKTERFKSIYSKFFKSSLEIMHLSFGDTIIFRNWEKHQDQEFIKNKLDEVLHEIKNGKNPIEDLIELKFENILVGDLIYDTYLRFFHKPTLISIDKDVIYTIEVALNLFYNFKSFLKFNNIKCLLTSYCTYIHHGIPLRLCLLNNIKVYTLGSTGYLIQEINTDFPYHEVNYSAFSAERKLTNTQLDAAREKLKSRFEGKIDDATSYMKQSAYFNNPTSLKLKKLFTQEKRNIIIYEHDFYDSPHVNRMLQFPDMYQYLKQSLDALTDLTGTSVFIKIHPNGIKGTREMTIELVNSYNNDNFHILDETVSNLNIIELQPDLVATARGTIGIEMAYFEIPTVALFDNPYVNFNFVHTCMKKENYFRILRGEEKTKIDFNKDEIYSYYYQTFLEKMESIDKHIWGIIHSHNGLCFDDKYLEVLLSNSDEIFCNKFIVNFNKALEN
jgi:hypothetical protein